MYTGDTEKNNVSTPYKGVPLWALATLIIILLRPLVVYFAGHNKTGLTRFGLIEFLLFIIVYSLI